MAQQQQQARRRTRQEADEEDAAIEAAKLARRAARAARMSDADRVAERVLILQHIERCGRAELIDDPELYEELISDGYVPYRDRTTLEDGIALDDLVRFQGTCVSRAAIVKYLYDTRNRSIAPRSVSGAAVTRADVEALGLDPQQYEFTRREIATEAEAAAAAAQGRGAPVVTLADYEDDEEESEDAESEAAVPNETYTVAEAENYTQENRYAAETARTRELKVPTLTMNRFLTLLDEPIAYDRVTVERDLIATTEPYVPDRNHLIGNLASSMLRLLPTEALGSAVLLSHALSRGEITLQQHNRAERILQRLKQKIEYLLTQWRGVHNESYSPFTHHNIDIDLSLYVPLIDVARRLLTHVVRLPGSDIAPRYINDSRMEASVDYRIPAWANRSPVATREVRLLQQDFHANVLPAEGAAADQLRQQLDAYAMQQIALISQTYLTESVDAIGAHGLFPTLTLVANDVVNYRFTFKFMSPFEQSGWRHVQYDAEEQNLLAIVAGSTAKVRSLLNLYRHVEGSYPRFRHYDITRHDAAGIFAIIQTGNEETVETLFRLYRQAQQLQRRFGTLPLTRLGDLEPRLIQRLVAAAEALPQPSRIPAIVRMELGVAREGDDVEVQLVDEDDPDAHDGDVLVIGQARGRWRRE